VHGHRLHGLAVVGGLPLQPRVQGRRRVSRQFGWTPIGIALLVKATLGLRVSEVQEYEGMDRSEHGENAYPMEP
jgi:hypothetical protein